MSGEVEPSTVEPVEPVAVEPAIEATSVERIAAAFADDSEDYAIESVVQLLGVHGTTFVYLAQARELEMDSENTFLILSFLAFENERLYQSFTIAYRQDEPGAETTRRLEAHVPTRQEHGVTVGGFSVVDTSAEFATDGECQQRASAATVRQTFQWFCAPGSTQCVVAPTKLEVLEPAAAINCRGRPVRSLEAAPAEYEMGLRVTSAAALVVTQVSGAVPEDIALGEHMIDELRGLRFMDVYVE